jgi:phosphoglycolate phosphatase-like HAD superfamily hydrolase
VLFFDSYDESRATGSFILVDPFSNATVAAGMIREDLSQLRDTGSAREIGSLGIGRKEVTSRERFERHGHRPAIFLLPKRDLLAESAERALFDKGFETVVLDGDAIPLLAVDAVLSGLWSAGLVVLFASGKIRADARRTLERLAGESLFDFANVEEGTELTGEIVSCAELLRVDRSARPFGKAD